MSIHRTKIGQGKNHREYVTVVVPDWWDDKVPLVVVHETHDSRGNVAHWEQHPLLDDTNLSGSHEAYVNRREAPPSGQPDE